VATVPSSRLPDEFKFNGLRNLPAIIHGSSGIDTVEEILDYIDDKFPSPAKDTFDNFNDVDVDKLARNFFSRCQSGLPDGRFFKPKIPIWVNFGVYFPRLFHSNLRSNNVT
jgi:hypothetical protein